MNSKLELMHEMFGATAGHKCAECSNLTEKMWDKVYRKCTVYGVSNSEATDWALSYPACGMFDKMYTSSRPIMDFARKEQKHENPIDGQITMEGET